MERIVTHSCNIQRDIGRALFVRHWHRLLKNAPVFPCRVGGDGAAIVVKQWKTKENKCVNFSAVIEAL
jgi:hypothetical protein